MRYAVHLFDVAATCCLKLGRLSNFRATFDLLLSTNQLVAYTSQLKSTKPHNRTINLLQATNQPEVDPCMPALMKVGPLLRRRRYNSNMRAEISPAEMLAVTLRFIGNMIMSQERVDHC